MVAWQSNKTKKNYGKKKMQLDAAANLGAEVTLKFSFRSFDNIFHCCGRGLVFISVEMLQNMHYI